MVGDQLQSSNETKPRIVVLGIDNENITLQWTDNLNLIPHGCYNLTQEFKMTHDEFMKSMWMKA